ncbi:MAG: hypothetical protein WC673_03350 [Candidatus Paceibacterota bacterium]
MKQTFYPYPPERPVLPVTSSQLTPPTQPVSQNNQIQSVFSSQSECEQTSGRTCNFQMCDVDCGKDFKKGWVPFSTYVALDINAPFSYALVLINENGSILYKEQKHDGKETQISGLTTQAQVAELMQWIADHKFSEWKDRPQMPDDPTDGTMFTINVRFPAKGSNGLFVYKNYRVQCYGFGCNQDFLELKNKIIELWGKEVLEIGV